MSFPRGWGRTGAMAALLLTAAAPASPADPMVTKREMGRQLELVGSVLRTAYAPAEWKRKHFGWDLDAEIAKAIARINAAPNPDVGEFRKVVRDFLLSPRDYHVTFSFAATEKATLPFRVRGAEGRYFLVHIDRNRLPETAFPFHVGDEVLQFDGKPIADVVHQLEATLGGNSKDTDATLAEEMLTDRSAKIAVDVPRGAVTLTLRKKGTDRPRTHQVSWDYQPEQVKSPELLDVTRSRAPSSSSGEPMLLTPWWHTFGAHTRLADASPYEMAARKSFLPALGKKIMETADTEPFHAYAYRSDTGKMIGYVRIPSYMAGANEVKAFAELMGRFEETTDALVIDQLNNPGGYLFYLYALASTLSDQALTTPRHRMALTSREVMAAVESVKQLEGIDSDEKARKTLGSDMNGYPITFGFAELLREFARFQIDEWNARHRLTRPSHLFGVDRINPHAKARYTKPILLLVNSLDFSGGDFFPAILQDNRRATILGTRTAGAGGYVLKVSYPNPFGLAELHYTGSLAERVDKNPLENLGVKPDVPYAFTRRDLEEDYVDYLKVIRATLQGMAR